VSLAGFGDRLWALQVSAGLYLLAAILLVSAMYAYDSLLMPQRFWGSRPLEMAAAGGAAAGWLSDLPA
jgi:hypothetical protein